MGCANPVFWGGVNGKLRLLVYNKLILIHTYDLCELFFCVHKTDHTEEIQLLRLENE